MAKDEGVRPDRLAVADGASLAIALYMRINVSGLNAAVNDDTRRYAAYRMFTSLAPQEQQIRGVDVVIRCDATPVRSFLCVVVVDLGSAGRIKTQARAAHPNAAIDRAADRTAWLVRRRTAQHFSLKSTTFSS